MNDVIEYLEELTEADCVVPEMCLDRITDAVVEIKRLTNEGKIYRKALEEIAEGKGPYNEDRLIHASNTIQDMTILATDALAAVQVAQGCQCDACRTDGPHDSDCAVHNAPAHPKGPCDCSVQVEQ